MNFFLLLKAIYSYFQVVLLMAFICVNLPQFGSPLKVGLPYLCTSVIVGGIHYSLKHRTSNQNVPLSPFYELEDQRPISSDGPPLQSVGLGTIQRPAFPSTSLEGGASSGQLHFSRCPAREPGACWGV